ncbi:MAG: carboxynorspermidine decarboxylase [Syntrophorhabdaceae bacterium]|nr:carboxynorspermidine decarboxylase [Syntrophorhabdaceae bacterium]
MGINRIDNIKDRILKKDTGILASFFRLTSKERKKIIEALGKEGLEGLTSIIKISNQKTFEEHHKNFLKLAEGKIHTPVYLIDEMLIEENMKILRYVKDRTGCKILHALKAYATFATFPVMKNYLDGVCASGLNEARLGFEKFKKEVHTFGPAYKDGDIEDIIKYSDVIIFNSFYQLERFGRIAKERGREIGIRVNPGYSDIKTEMYNPCAFYSRLGIVFEIFKKRYKEFSHLIDGLHFHALCEQNADSLGRVLNSFKNLFGTYLKNLKNLKWVNFGGGHHITRDDYDIEHLIYLINEFKEKYGVQVHLEPGEASVLNAGVLISTVLDIVENKKQIAIIDASAEAHMPDVLLMPYKPFILNAGEPGEKKYEYRIGGPSCLAGDVVGDYSFDKPLKRGDKLVFKDMALYSIVKNTTFNGINLPDIAVLKKTGEIKLIKRFGYKDYLHRQS